MLRDATMPMFYSFYSMDAQTRTWRIMTAGRRFTIVLETGKENVQSCC